MRIAFIALLLLVMVSFGFATDDDLPAPEAEGPNSDPTEGVGNITYYKVINGEVYVSIGRDDTGTFIYVPASGSYAAPLIEVITTRIRDSSGDLYNFRTIWYWNPTSVPRGSISGADLTWSRINTAPPVVKKKKKGGSVPIVPFVPVWKDVADPEIRIVLGPYLKKQDFISTDKDRTISVETNMEEVTWSAVGKDKSGDLTFSPLDDKSAIVGFNVPAVKRDKKGKILVRPNVFKYIITAEVIGASDTVTIVQNNLSQLRQEYVDLKTVHSQVRVPAVSAFDTEASAYQMPNSHLGLLNTQEFHDHHEFRILKQINKIAKLVNKTYTAGIVQFTAGYACPLGNQGQHAANSKHIYGKGIDFDMGGDNKVSSKKNYDVAKKAENISGVERVWLYDNKKKRYRSDQCPEWPTMPAGFNGSHYGLGQIDLN